MNLWDSVHRGLEKASQETSRLAKTQRLRSAIDKIGHQVQEREANLLNNTLQIFHAGALTQPELIPLCQEIAQLREQFAQLQSELQQTNTRPQTNPGGPATPEISGPNTYPSQGANAAYTVADEGSQMAPPPPYHSYADVSTPIPAPPPPPGIYNFGVASHETQYIPPAGIPAQQIGTRTCPQCGQITQQANAFCQNCGTPLENSGTYQPTIRASSAYNLPGVDNASSSSDPNAPAKTPDGPVTPEQRAPGLDAHDTLAATEPEDQQQ